MSRKITEDEKKMMCEKCIKLQKKGLKTIKELATEIGEPESTLRRILENHNVEYAKKNVETAVADTKEEEQKEDEVAGKFIFSVQAGDEFLYRVRVCADKAKKSIPELVGEIVFKEIDKRFEEIMN